MTRAGLLAIAIATMSCTSDAQMNGPGASVDTDTDAGTEGTNGDHGETSPPECVDFSDCPGLASCVDGMCVDDDSDDSCGIVDDGQTFRCTPPDPNWCVDDTDCDDGFACEDYTCVCVEFSCAEPPPPGAPQATPPCDVPLEPAVTTIGIDTGVRDVAALDVDADGVAEIVVLDLDHRLHALTLDGSVVATLDLGEHVGHELWTVDDAWLLAPGYSQPDAYALARIDVTAPAMLSMSLSAGAPGELQTPTRLRDFDGDGTTDLAVLASGRFHQWILDAPPVLGVDASFDATGHVLEAVDLDGNGSVEVLSLDATRMWRVTIVDGAAMLVDPLNLPGERAGTATIHATGELDRLVVGTEVVVDGETWTALSVADGPGGVPQLREPFGTADRLRWMTGVDLDGDGVDELAVAHADGFRSLPMHLFRMTPDGTPQCHSIVMGVGRNDPTTGDVTGDGIADLIVPNPLEIQVWSLAPL